MPKKQEGRVGRHSSQNPLTGKRAPIRKRSLWSRKDTSEIQWEEDVLQGLKYLNLFLLLSIFVGGAAAFKTPDATIKLDKEDLKFLFGEKEAPPHSIISIRSRSREKRSSEGLIEDPGLMDVVVEDDEEKIELELHPNTDLVSPDFLLVVRDDDGVHRETGVVRPSCIYVGEAKDRPDTIAALSNCDGNGFTGVIVSSNYTHLVKPLPSNSLRRRRRRRRQATPNILDMSEDDNDDDEEDDIFTPDGLHIIHSKSRDSKCGVFNVKAMRAAPRVLVKLPDLEDQEEHTIEKRAASKKLQIETAVFVDNVMYDLIGKQKPNAVQEVTNIVFAIMNGVHILYNAPSLDIHFNIMLVRLEIIKSATKGPSKSNGDIQNYLNSFCYWQRTLNRKENPGGDSSPGFWDHALMLSGLDLFEGDPKSFSVIGLAWVSGMCHPTYSCTINEGTSFEAVYVITHEMGHNLGMTHDGDVADNNKCDPKTYIMSPSTGPGKITWSKCSNLELKSFLKSQEYTPDCLDDTPRGPRKLDFTASQLLPGEIYKLNDQCTHALGSAFKPYVTSKSPYDLVCREIWCQNTTHAIRIHPALEGTSCGIKKFCVNGKCQTKPSVVTTTPDPRTTNIPTKGPTKKPTGFRDFFRRIRNLFQRYMFLRHDLPVHAFSSKWTRRNQTTCSAACGGGWLTCNVSCATFEGQIIVEDDMCDPDEKPPNKYACNMKPCQVGDLLSTSLPTTPSEAAMYYPGG